MSKITILENDMLIIVNARRWHDRKFGNTYFAGEIVVGRDDGTLDRIILPIQYGYGDQYMTAAGKALTAAGYMPEGVWPRSYFFGRLIDFVSDVARKGDL